MTKEAEAYKASTSAFLTEMPWNSSRLGEAGGCSGRSLMRRRAEVELMAAQSEKRT